MKNFVIYKTVHGERFTFSNGHNVVGIRSINLVQAHKYQSGKTTTSLEQTKQSSRVHTKKRYRSLKDGEHALEKNLMDSEDTGVQVIGTGLKSIRSGNKVLWDTYRLGRVFVPRVGKVVLGSGKRIYTLGSKTVIISKGLVSGTIVLDRSTVLRIKNHTSQKVKAGLSKTKHILKRLPEKSVGTVKKGLVSAGRSVIGTGARETSNVLANSNDIGLESIVAAKDFTKYGYRTLKTVAKGSYRAGYTTARAVGVSNRFVRQVKKDGLKATSRKALTKMHNKIRDKISATLLNLVKKLVLNPYTLGLILIFVVAAGSAAMGGGAVAAVVPGGKIEAVVSDVSDGLQGIYEKVKDTITDVADWISGNDPNVDMSGLSVEEYLIGATALYREDVINRIYESQQDYLDSNYHVIRIINLYGAEVRAELTSVDRGFIANSVISTEDIVEIIMPLFNSIMLGTYRGQATVSELNSLTEELNNMITDFEISETSVEECDGYIDTCLNPSEKLYHDSDSGLDCCVTSTSYCDSLGSCSNIQKTEIPVYETVDGELVQTGTVELEFCGGHPDFYCNGYTVCLGHNVITFILGNKSIDELMQVYFLDRIDELNNKSSLTNDEINELRNLEQNYQFAMGLFEIYNE